MRTLNVIGRVVSDAQVKSSKNGRAYVEFRFANNEYNDKDNTFWARVVSFDNKYVNLAEYYTKGKLLVIEGDYSNKVYSTQDGKCAVDNNIVAFKIDFVSGGNNEGGHEKTTATTTEQIPTVTTTTESKVAPAVKAASKKKTTPKPAPVVADDEDDDLPF